MFGAFKTFQSRTQLNVADDNYSISAAYGHLETDGYRPNGGGLKKFLQCKWYREIKQKDQLSFFASRLTRTSTLQDKFHMTIIMQA